MTNSELNLKSIEMLFAEKDKKQQYSIKIRRKQKK
mgnify:FL=1